MKKTESVFKSLLPAVVAKAEWVIVADGQEAVSGHVTEAEAVEKCKELAEERDWRGTRLSVHKVKADHAEPGEDNEPDDDDQPRVVATDKEDDDEMTEADRKARGVAASASEEDSEDKKGKRKATTKVAKGTFKSVIYPGMRTFDIGETGRVVDDDTGDRIDPSAEEDGDLEPADTGVDRLGRAYLGEVRARVLGANARLDGGDPNVIPSAGAGPTREHDSRGVPNSGFRPMQNGDDAMIGGAEKPYTAVHPHGGYELIAEGMETGSVRVGDFAVLTPTQHGIAPAASFKAPTADTSVLKSKNRGNLFRKIAGQDVANLG